jgi:hypothetical protein
VFPHLQIITSGIRAEEAADWKKPLTGRGRVEIVVLEGCFVLEEAPARRERCFLASALGYHCEGSVGAGQQV